MTTVIACGCAWCRTCLTDDGWDEGSPAAQVVPLFEEACAAMGRGDILWCPQTAEVTGEAARGRSGKHIAHMDGGEPRLDLDALREAVSEAVYDAAMDGREATLDDLGDLERFAATEAA